MKRLFDIVLSLLALVFLSVILVILSAFVYFKHGSPVFFRQERPGQDGKPFGMVKYRTMTTERDSAGHLLVWMSCPSCGMS